MKIEAITLRPATKSDADMILDWRNDPLSRKMSLNSAEVKPAEHQAWLLRTLSASHRYLFIAEHNRTPIGQVRFDIHGDQAEISLTVAPEHRGKRYSQPIIRSALRWIKQKTQVKEVMAVIKAENNLSKRAFSKCGFKYKDKTPVKGVEAERWTLSTRQIPDSEMLH